MEYIVNIKGFCCVHGKGVFQANEVIKCSVLKFGFDWFGRESVH